MKFPARLLFAVSVATFISLAPTFADEPTPAPKAEDSVDGANKEINIGLIDRAPSADSPGSFILNRASFSLPEPSK
jgi:hypothetical protein